MVLNNYNLLLFILIQIMSDIYIYDFMSNIPSFNGAIKIIYLTNIWTIIIKMMIKPLHYSIEHFHIDIRMIYTKIRHI